MKTKRHDDKLGYNPDTIPRKPNTRYVISEKSKELWAAIDSIGFEEVFTELQEKRDY